MITNQDETNKTVETPLRIDAPMSAEEKVFFKRFIKETGKSQGPWTKFLIFKAMKEENYVLQPVDEKS
jgi:hypothetical protein